MTAAQRSITGFTTIPFGERVARPTGRRTRSNPWKRMLLARRERRAAGGAWEARRAAEVAAAPTETHPRDHFTLRHAGDELRRL